MKSDSVQFYKVLSILVYLTFILVPLILAVVFGVLFSEQQKISHQLESQLTDSFRVQEPVRQTATALAPPDLAAQRQTMAPAVLTQAAEPSGQLEPSFAYQVMYPHLYVSPPPSSSSSEQKMCYLTFDDGPSDTTTRRILDTLEEYGIKATFFVTGENTENNPEIIQAAVQAGHTIGVHSWSHDYQTIYRSVEDYLEDFDKMYCKIEEITGVAPTIFRFPGGSINVHNRTTYMEIIAEMTRRGFVFYDWNTAGSDAVVGGISQREIVSNVLNGVSDQDSLVILLHDRRDNSTTASALPEIIESLQKSGYMFGALTNQVEPVTYFYPN